MNHELPVSAHGNLEDLGKAAAAVAVRAIQHALDTRGQARVMLAAAPSQLPVLEALAQSGLDFSNVSFVHMDDYIGLSPEAPQGFGNWLETNFLSKLEAHGPFHRIDASKDPEQAADEYHEILGEEPFDLTLCGLGTNAHLAFNDPGSSFTDERRARHVRLATASRQQQVDEGHFATLEDVPEYAITVTIPRLLNTAAVVCSVLGEAKRQAVADTLANDPTESIPGTALKLHPDAHLFIDEGADPRE